jgi:hypothetical protein
MRFDCYARAVSTPDRKLTRAAAWAGIIGVPLSLISIGFGVFTYLVPKSPPSDSAIRVPVTSSQTSSAGIPASSTEQLPTVTAPATPAPATTAFQPGAFQLYVEIDGKRTYLGWLHTWSWWQLMLWWTIPAVAVLALGAFAVAKLSEEYYALIVAAPVSVSYLSVFQYSISALGLLAAVVGFLLMAGAAAVLGKRIT